MASLDVYHVLTILKWTCTASIEEIEESKIHTIVGTRDPKSMGPRLTHCFYRVSHILGVDVRGGIHL